VNTVGALTCNPLFAGQQRNLLEPCDIQMLGTANQIDQCAPGLVCLMDSCGSGRCYQFCRNDMDCTICRGDAECTNAPCNRDLGTSGYKVCDVPYHDCSPLKVPDNSGCPGSALGCYLSTTDPSQTICDCQVPPGFREGDVCTLSRQCFVGLVCVDTGGMGTKQCTPVCRLGAVPSDCGFGTCRTYMEGGVANLTYGYCK
jgi:hypothetical protein